MAATQFYPPGSVATGSRSLNSLGQDFRTLTSLSQNFWVSVFELGTRVLDDTLQVTERLQSSALDLRPRRVCEIPAYPCPDPFLGTVMREAYIGEQILLPLKVKNTTRRTRTFHFRTEALRNVQGETASALELSPSQYTLAPGEVRILEASLSVSREEFTPGLDYTSDIVVSSETCDPQLLRVVLRVKTVNAAPLIKLKCPCDPPVRRVNWYDHFYCDLGDEPRETSDQIQR